MRVAQAVIWAGVVAMGASAPTLAAPTPGTVGPARWDAARMAIEVPYQGDVPQPHFFRLTPSHFYYDWGPARCKAGRPQENRLSGVVQRFALANRPGGDVRLAVQTASAAVPLLEIDRRSQELIVYPTGKRTMLGAHPVPHSSAPSQQAVLPPPPVIPSPSSDDWSEPLRFFAHPVAVKPPEHLAPPTRRNALLTMLGKPVLDDFHHRLVLAYQGEPPAYAMQAYAKNPRWVYFDFPNTSFPLEGARFDSYTDRVFEGWLLSQRQGGLRTRLYLKLTQAMPVQAKVFPASHEIWLTASVPSPSPSPSPTPVLAPLSLPASAASTPLATSTVVPSTAPR